MNIPPLQVLMAEAAKAQKRLEHCRRLCDDLSDLCICAIVQSEAPSPHINADYAQYSSAVAIGVYRNNYLNLHYVLAGAYPVIEQLVGRDFFRHLARSFIQQHGLKNANLHHYGAQMADFFGDI